MTTTAPDPAVVAFALTEDDLQLSAGILPGYDPTNPICGLCGEHETFGVILGVVAKGVTGRLCEACAEGVGPLGEALIGLVDALETIASAVARPTDRRSDLLALAARAVQWLRDADEDGAGRD